MNAPLHPPAATLDHLLSIARQQRDDTEVYASWLRRHAADGHADTRR